MDTNQHIIIHLLKENSINKTAPRVAVMQVLMLSETMLCLSDILKRLNYAYGRVTVYRALRAFCRKQLIHKMVDLQNTAYYRFNNIPEHTSLKEINNGEIYFKCENCGGITILKANKKKYPLPNGFIQTATNFLIAGYCDHCASKTK
jgi:Fe2+ or Zn2+ uptake regulation protein